MPRNNGTWKAYKIPVIAVSHITKKFPTVTALDGVSLEVRDKEFFGLLGPNGAGKTTLMNLLVGYLDPDGGEIRIGSKLVTRDSLASRRNIGLVPQSLALYDDISAEDNLEIFGSLYDMERRALKDRIAELLESVGLFDRRKDRVKTFSGGMKRRLNLIASLLHRPPVLLCDEPTVGVDPQSRNAIFEYLRKLNGEGTTIVYTTHYMEEAERLCDRIGIIDAGRIISMGTVEELLELLPFEETVAIARNSFSPDKREVLEQFGRLTEEEDHWELEPGKGFRMSEFFLALERHDISYKSVGLRRPTLEALFLHLTGRNLRD